MPTKDRQAAQPHTVTRAAPPVGLMAVAFALSWLSMLGHNLAELPLTAADIENTGPLMVDVMLLFAYWRRPSSRGVQVAILGWAGLNLLIGGLVTVLPLPFLPFAPEQTLSHYLTHIAYALGQLPLLVAALGALRASTRVSSA